MEGTLVPPTGAQLHLFPMAPPTSIKNALVLILATLRCLPLVANGRFSAAFATGGYVSIPASIAVRLMRVPLVVFLPDVVPGKAVKLLVPLARRIAVSTDDARRYLPPEKVTVTGYPVRDSFLEATREEGRKRLELPDDARVLCVLGGSQGARAINEALAAHLPTLLNSFFVIHICGEQRFPEAQAVADTLSPGQRKQYRLYPYMHDPEIAYALAAADLAVCRSGASVLGELPAVGTPAILVPLPIPGVHQRENAEYLAQRGAAVILEDQALTERLGYTVHELLSNDSRLRTMEMASRSLARPDAAAAMARVLEETLR
ncbi:MAG TPA: UDP-N-acetylglucosamine--N-acetylmuramyl-(pentapeptide) pyrophosphoryl-undecaprenol N-acetylglucosamine transferase [Chloroflexota bacterium]